MEWYWKKRRVKRRKTIMTHYYETARPTVKDDAEAAVLKALTGKAKRGRVQLFSSDLDTLYRFKALKDAVDKWRGGKPQSVVQRRGI